MLFLQWKITFQLLDHFASKLTLMHKLQTDLLHFPLLLKFFLQACQIVLAVVAISSHVCEKLTSAE